MTWLTVKTIDRQVLIKLSCENIQNFSPPKWAVLELKNKIKFQIESQ
jgi:hypothetical protein